MPTRDWNASSYDGVSAPQQEWGAAVVARLALRGDETVLDAGAGTGRVSEMVLERLPRGALIAVDGSPSMAALARERLADERVSVICSDLLALELPERVDAVISTATFHWILDHDALFERMRALLREGGQFVAQCGGEGNIARVREAIEEVSRELAPELSDEVTTDEHLADQASNLYAAEFDEGRSDDLRAELAALERAEARLAAGTYGRSIESGEPIPDERLEVLPTAERTAPEQAAFDRSA